MTQTFPIQNGLTQSALSPVLFNFAIEYAITNTATNEKGLKLPGTH